MMLPSIITSENLLLLASRVSCEEEIRAAIDSKDEYALTEIISSNRKMINKHIDVVRISV